MRARGNSGGRAVAFSTQNLGSMSSGGSLSWLEEVEFKRFAVLTALGTAAISSWLVTAATIRIAELPPDAFFYASQLPRVYWLGLISTFALFALRNLVKNRAKTILEISALLLLSMYLFALPSFVYQDPRFLDTYQHEGNALALLGSGGWFNGPVWYVYQFPGAYVFFAQLTAIPGIDPFQLMKYYPAGISLVLAFLVYATARSYSRNYAAVSTAFILSGFWFQLHLSPQSLELIPYFGVLFLLLKIIEDPNRRRLWTAMAMGVSPVLVMSHPETPLVLAVGMVAFFILKPLFTPGRITAIRSGLSTIGPFFLVLSVVTAAWWSIIAAGALGAVEGILNGALSIGVSGLAHGAPAVPSTPAPSYQVAVLSQQAISASVWLLGLSLLLMIRKFRLSEYFLAGLFLAAISTIPIALFANADVLQRAYLFALFPEGLLLASLLERKDVLRLRGTSLVPVVGKGLLFIVMVFSILIPVTHYGGDSFDYLTQSSLFTSNVAAGLTDHSVLLLHPGWYGWRYYVPFHGYYGAVLLEQKNISDLHGGYVKLKTYDQYNLTFTPADGTANYLLLPDYFQNLYILRYGSNSTFFLGEKVAFENNFACLSGCPRAELTFNLVYSTGTDRLYENSNLG